MSLYCICCTVYTVADPILEKKVSITLKHIYLAKRWAETSILGWNHLKLGNFLQLYCNLSVKYSKYV